MITIPSDGHLTHMEYISRIDSKRQQSEIINNLCARIEQLCHESGLLVATNSTHNAECPVCAAQLHVDYDADLTMFIVETAK